MIKSFEQEEFASLSATTRELVLSGLRRLLESSGLKYTYRLVTSDGTLWIRGSGYRCKSVESAEAAILALISGWKLANEEHAEREARSERARRAAKIGAKKRRMAAKKKAAGR